MNVLDLFSGIGGFSLGLERAGPFRTVAFCEREPFCQAVLRKHWPDTPIYDDVRTIPTDELGDIDLICGGFPCQPWSVAGQQRGTEDDRDLWPAMAALVKKLRPTWVIGENVRGFVNEPMGLKRSLSDLESLGYEAAAFVIPACAVDAPHRRDRVWIVAYSPRIGSDGREYKEHDRAAICVSIRTRGGAVAHADGRGHNRTEKPGICETTDGIRVSNNTGNGSVKSDIFSDTCGIRDQGADREPVKTNNERPPKRKQERGVGGSHQAQAASKSSANTHDEGPQGGLQDGISNEKRREKSGDGRASECSDWGDGVRDSDRITEPRMGGMADGVSPWLDEPDIGRVATGVKNRAGRLKALGNAVVPQVVEQIGRAIMAS